MKRARGFSLIEVLVAFTLLAIALGILVAILSGGLAQVRQAGDATEATLHAQSLLDERIAMAPIEPGSEQGDFDDGRYRWSLEITEVPDPAPVAAPAAEPGAAPIESVGLQLASAPLVYRLQLDVRWGEDEPARSIRFVTLRVRVPPQPLAPLP
ncbi:MAG: type II secretion system protein [Arenimonas sp.]|nr:type II secretion system protein [Arenimonas sp.]